MTIDDSSAFPKMSFTHSHTTSHSNVHNDELHECPICVFQTLEIPTVPDAFNHVFSTNNPPDDTLLASLHSSLASIRSLFAKIEKHLAAMQHARDACALSIKKHEAAVHPIRSLPDDILLTIFRWHIHSEVYERPYGNRILYLRLPWTFLYVSHRWRTLTLSSPLLWIAINIRQSYSCFLPSLDDKWNFVIERTADCDLVVTIDDESSGYNLASLMKSLHLLSRTTTRWRKLNIHARRPVLSPLVKCSYERLTELVWDLSSSFGAPQTNFHNTLNLRRLTVLGSSPLNLRWDLITDYSCNPAGFQYLPKLTAMEHLSLDLTPSPGASPLILSAPVSLASVRSLSIKEGSRCAGQSLRQLSHLLHFPSLNDLAIISECGTLPSFRKPLKNLGHLILLSNAPLGNISAFLTSHDSVESLHIENKYVLQLLRIIPGRLIILPNLTSLSTGADALGRYAETFFEIVESRCGDDGGDVVRLMELEIVGTERARRQAMNAISEESTLSERWNTVRGKINVVEKDENGSTRKY